MKLTYDKIIVIVIIAVIALSLIIPKKYFWNPIKGSFSYVVSPVQGVVTKGGRSVYNFFSLIGNISNLSKENNQLKEENNRLLTENANLNEVEKENEILRQQLDFKNKNNYKLVGAQIIAKDPTNIQNSITINVGKNDGLEEEMPVISSGMLVGKISEVHLSSSKVTMITNPNSIVNAMIQKSRANGIVKGELGYGLIMESIPQETKINIADLVVTSGLGGTYPKGLIIGEISEIISKQGEIFQTASVRPIIDFSQLEIVFVITGV